MTKKKADNANPEVEALRQMVAEAGHDIVYMSPEAKAQFDAARGTNAQMIRNLLGATPEDPKSANVVPSVEERGKEGVSRGDIFSMLLKKRIILLEGQVDDNMASLACASLHYLSSAMVGEQERSKPIQVFINSPGGSVLAGLAIYDTMRFIDAPVTTVGFGMQASMGSVLLAAGDNRMMTENAHLMIHQIASSQEGKASDLQVSLSLSHKLHEQLKSIYVRHIGLKHEFWDIVLERDTWLTADQALKMGFIKEIVPIAAGKKTAYEDESIRDEFHKAAEARVPGTLEGIKAIINNASSGIGDNAAIRPEMVTALSQYKEFWTTGKLKEYAAEHDVKLSAGMSREKILAAIEEGSSKKEVPSAAGAERGRRKKSPDGQDIY